MFDTAGYALRNVLAGSRSLRKYVPADMPNTKMRSLGSVRERTYAASWALSAAENARLSRDWNRRR
jgi:hypothetical protein